MSELGSMSPPCASPMIGGLDGDASAMAEIDQLSSSGSKATESQGFRAGDWEGDTRKLDEVLAFHSRQRTSDDLLKEFRAEQRSAKSSRNASPRSTGSSKGSRSPSNGSKYQRDRTESVDSVTF